MDTRHPGGQQGRLAKPAPATTVTRRRAPTSSRRRSSSGRSTQAAGSAGGRILLAGVRDRNLVTVASATLLVPSLDGRVSPNGVPTPRGCRLVQPANRSARLGRYPQKTSSKLHPGPLRHLYPEADLALRDRLDRIHEATGNAE